jgi:hypothetical protein
MGVDTGIPPNGTYNIENLQTATGISSSSLFSFGPGTPNSVAVSDFVCKGIGRPYDDAQGSEAPQSSAVVSDWERKLVPSAVNGSSTDANGSYDSQDPPFYTFDDIDELNAATDDTFQIRVLFHTLDLGDFFYEQILDGPGFSETGSQTVATLQSISPVTDGNGKNVGADLKYEMIGFAPNFSIAWTWDDGLNLNGTNFGTASSDRDGNSLPESGGLVFRTEDVNDGSPLVDRFDVKIEDQQDSFGTIYFDFNVDLFDNNIGEGNVVYDPGNQIDAQFYVYQFDPSTNSPYNNGTEPDFLATNNTEQQVSQFSESDGNRSVEFYCEIRDQGGSTIDVVRIVVDENDTGTWPTSEEIYQYTTSSGRSQGTISSPVTMNYNGQIA